MVYAQNISGGKKQPSPKPVDIDTSDFRDVQLQQCPACCTQSCKLLSLRESLCRASASVRGFAVEMLLYGKKNQCDGPDAARTELEAGRARQRWPHPLWVWEGSIAALSYLVSKVMFDNASVH